MAPIMSIVIVIVLLVELFNLLELKMRKIKGQLLAIVVH